MKINKFKFGIGLVLLIALTIYSPVAFMSICLTVFAIGQLFGNPFAMGYPNTAGATTIASLWTPDIWIRTLNEKINTFPGIIASNIVKRTPEFDALASGGGIIVHLPYFRDISDQADSVQVEQTQPTLQALGSGLQIAPVMNRESGLASTALAAVIIGSGESPVEGIVSQLAIRRQKQRQVTILSILRGIFGFNSVPGGAGALSAVRNDVFSETGANPSGSQLINPFVFADSVAKLGELADTTMGGAIFMHPLIRAALIKQDQIAFTHYSDQSGTLLTGEASTGMQKEFYKGYRVVVSNLLFRAGAASGYVFDTYIAAPGVFAWGEKPQVDGMMLVDVASLSYFNDPRINQAEIYDRSRFLLHPNGLKWVGTPAGQSAANSELIVAGNWTLDYVSADRVGIVCLRTNG